ncbi:MAG: hypothetical protein K8T90_11365 [Planctomycetes bacterium]|nr:hypothetical protein [Planctomycetota bacterium]
MTPRPFPATLRRVPVLARLAVFAVIAVVAAAFGVRDTASAQDQGGAPAARIATAEFDAPKVARGRTARLLVTFDIQDGYHVYAQDASESQRPTFEWTLPTGWTADAVEDVTKPTVFTGFGDKENVHEGKPVLAQTFTVGADAALGAIELKGKAAWQFCNDSMCEFVKGYAVVAKIEVVAGAAPAVAQPTPKAPFAALPELPPVRIAKARFDPAHVPRGGTARLLVHFEIAAGHHMYPQTDENQRPSFEWTLPKGWAVGPVTDLSPTVEFTGFGHPEQVLEGKVTVAQTFTIGADADLGTVELKGTSAWQSCDSGNCTPSKNNPVSAKVEIVAASSAAPVAPIPPKPQVAEGATPPAQAPVESSGLATILGQAMFWGLLTVLTPCVFPLLPVTVSFFSKQKGPALPRALVYAFGIVFTITVIGLIFKSGLDVMARGWMFNLAIGVLFLALSFSLFGLFDLRLPGFLTDWSTSKAGQGGMIGPFFMAVTLALTSFSCSMPFLATMFSQFDQGDKVQSVLGLVVYGSTMALPFFLCSLFPAAIQSLPRAGAWMNAVKVTMGFVEFALAFKFLRTVSITFGWDVLPRGLVLAIWVACTLGAALYLFGYVVLPHDTKVESIGVFRLVFALVFLSSAVYLFPGVQGRPLASWIEGFLQTQASEIDVGRAGGGGSEHHEWPKNDWDGALARAKLAQRPVLLDFTGVG